MIIGREVPAIPGKWLAGCMAVSMIVLAGLMHQAGLSLNPAAASNEPFYACGALAIGLRVGLRRRATRRQRFVGDIAESFAVFTAIALIGAVASYPAAAESRGLVDPGLVRLDTAMGFNWVSWYRITAAHPALQVAGRFAYQSIYWTPAVILGAFAWAGRLDLTRMFLLRFWVAALLTLLLFRLMPAVGPLAYQWRGPVPYMPESALWEAQLIPALRQHQVHLVDLGRLRGLVSVPSFHAAAAVLYMGAARPLARLRWPVVAVNTLMLLATPVEGTHYLADLIAGGMVAGVAWSAVGWLTSYRASQFGQPTAAAAMTR